MQVLVAHAPREMAFEERPKPEPGPGEVLVKTRVVALCGSDIHLYNGTHPYRTYPMIFGHEASGWVTQVGEGVSELSEGDHVVLEPCIWCGECYPCSIGRYNCCSQESATAARSRISTTPSPPVGGAMSAEGSAGGRRHCEQRMARSTISTMSSPLRSARIWR